MKLSPPVNENYAATVVRVRSLLPLQGLDNLKALPVFGYQALVDKTTQLDDLLLVFPAETQLSELFCKKNNLYRHTSLNEDQTKQGYLDDNRRVRAIKIRGHRSDALVLPINALSFLGEIRNLQEGMAFDSIEGVAICGKYELPRSRQNSRGSGNSKPRIVRFEKLWFPEHFDTTNFFKVKDRLDPQTNIIVTQKLHGTSLRVGNVLVHRQFTRIERFLNRFFNLRLEKTEYDYLYGTRRSIKDPKEISSVGYYGTNLWAVAGEQIEAVLPKGWVLYAEIIGWTSQGKPIQKYYTYHLTQGTSEVYVYRISQVNPSGVTVDLSWDQVRQFCTENNLRHVPELYRGRLVDFPLQDYIDTQFYKSGLWGSDVVPLAPESPVDEGICIRIEGLTPQIFKAKSPMFLQHETKLIDSGTSDLETTESE